MKVAAVKPDHLGDLVLAAPAIREISRFHGGVTVFVASSAEGLAHYLFPEAEIVPLDLPHLAKFRDRSAACAQSTVDLHGFDTVYFLRQDQVFTPEWTRLMARRAVLVEDRQDMHETRMQADVLHRSGLSYALPDGFLPAPPVTAPPRRVGLCISAGFYANRWPTLRWYELGRLLQARGVAITLLCGPFECEEAGLLARLLHLHPETGVVAGGSDFQTFLESVGALDLVVGNDGGTAHICSLVAPVLSLFGGSPYRRFAPFGRYNRLITRNVACSPCCQYHEALVNGCTTVECLTAIQAASVLRAVFATPLPAGESLDLGDGCQLIWGVSHS